ASSKSMEMIRSRYCIPSSFTSGLSLRTLCGQEAKRRQQAVQQSGSRSVRSKKRSRILLGKLLQLSERTGTFSTASPRLNGLASLAADVSDRTFLADWID